MNTQQINVTQQVDGSLIPHPAGEGVATITYQNDPVNGMTAIIAFAGCNQAVVTYDQSGKVIVSYFPYNQMNTASIENIVSYLNSQTRH